MVPKCKRVGRYKQRNIPVMDIITAGEETVPKLDAGCEDGS